MWKSEQAAEPCLDVRKRQEVKDTSGARAGKESASAGSTKQQAWMFVSEIPASLDAAGLFDPVAASQLMILKNLEMQFRASGLRLKITLNLKQPASSESLQNAIRDLGLSGITASKTPDHESLAQPTTRLVAPGGKTVREWHETIGPADIGLAVRRILGDPYYSGMESEVH